MSTEGMEILRVVAKITLWRDYYPDGPDLFVERGQSYVNHCIKGLTPAHVRQARAIVAAAERKAQRAKVWNPDAPAGQVGCAVDDDNYDHTVDCPEGDAPMEGPEPSPQPPAPDEGGRSFPIMPRLESTGGRAAKEQAAQETASLARLRIGREAPAEGGTDVAGLIEDLKTAFAALPYSRKLQARLQDIRNLGDALTAQAAALAAKEVERREQVSVREVRIAELEAVLIARKKEPSR